MPTARNLPSQHNRSRALLDPRDREFLLASMELVETPPSPILVAGLWMICAVVAVGLIWSYFGRLDIHAIAQGRIQPSGRSKVVQPLEPGKVAAIRVDVNATLNLTRGYRYRQLGTDPPARCATPPARGRCGA
jgi:hypothetical protein